MHGATPIERKLILLSLSRCACTSACPVSSGVVSRANRRVMVESCILGEVYLVYGDAKQRWAACLCIWDIDATLSWSFIDQSHISH
jgi:hypothetical protein